MAAIAVIVGGAVAVSICGEVIARRQDAITRQFDVNREFWNAVLDDHAESASEAIRHAANVDLKGENGGLALIDAVYAKRSSSLIQFLIEREANPTIPLSLLTDNWGRQRR